MRVIGPYPGLYEESANELAYTKEYFDKVLTEIKTNENELDN